MMTRIDNSVRRIIWYIMDVIAVNKFLLGMKELEVGAQTNADLNGNGTVDGDDALLLLKMVLGIKD